MNIKRRSFIKGLLALPLLSLIPIYPEIRFGRVENWKFYASDLAEPAIPTIWHDEQMFEAIMKASKAMDDADVPQDNRWVWYKDSTSELAKQIDNDLVEDFNARNV
jgi:hypothetical protein